MLVALQTINTSMFKRPSWPLSVPEMLTRSKRCGLINVDVLCVPCEMYHVTVVDRSRRLHGFYSRLSCTNPMPCPSLQNACNKPRNRVRNAGPSCRRYCNDTETTNNAFRLRRHTLRCLRNKGRSSSATSSASVASADEAPEPPPSVDVPLRGITYKRDVQDIFKSAYPALMADESDEDVCT
jgi:hypothetical protein